MFSELFESVARPSSKRKRWAVVISAAIQTICLLILVLVPLIYTRALPKAIVNTDLVAFTGGVSHPTTQGAPVKAVRHAARLFHNNVLTMPRHFPPHARVFEESPLPPEAPIS